MSPTADAEHYPHRITGEELAVTTSLADSLLAARESYPELDKAVSDGEPFWTTNGAQEDFTFEGFPLAPFFKVVRKSDGTEGSIRFTHRPRFYFGFEPA